MQALSGIKTTLVQIYQSFELNMMVLQRPLHVGTSDLLGLLYRSDKIEVCKSQPMNSLQITFIINSHIQ